MLSEDTYDIERLLHQISRSVDDLAYRVYTIEDTIAEINAYIEEDKLEVENA